MTIAALGISIEGKGVKEAPRDLDAVTAAATRTEKATDKLAPASKKAGEGIKSMGASTRTTEGAFGRLAIRAVALGVALAGAFAVGSLSGYADAWTDMQSRVGSALKDMAAAPLMMQRITDIANASYSPLAQTVEIYGRNLTSMRDFGRSAAETADFTEALNHALVTTATKGQDADVVLNSLSRSISKGKLDLEAYDVIISRSPRVLEAMADELGTTTTGLRALAQQGKVTGTVIVDSMLNSLERLRDEAGQMPATLADAKIIWNNVFTEVVGRIDQAWNASGRLAEKIIEISIAFRGAADVVIRVGNIVGGVLAPAFDLLASNMETAGQVGAVVGAALVGFFAGPALIGGIAAATAAIVTGFVPALGAVLGGIKAISLAMMANPLGLLIGGLAAAVTAAFIFRDEIKQAIGVDVFEVVKGAANNTIGLFVGAYDAIVAGWSLLPDAFSDIFTRAMNGSIDIVQNGVNGIIGALRNIPGLGDLQDTDLSGFKREESGASQRIGGVVQGAFMAGFSQDHIGNLSNGLKEVWANADGATGAMTGLMDSVGGGGGGAGAGTGKESPYAKLVRGAHEFIAAQNLEAQALGMTAEAAARLRYEQDLLNKAANDNIALSPTQRQELMGLASAMAAAEERTRMLTQAANDNAALWSSAQDGVSGIIKTWARGGDILDTVRNKLLDIGDMLIDMAVRNLFQNAFSGGGFGGGGGGLLGGMIIPGILHTGGVAGSAGYDHSRSFASSVWDGAPRYHDGTMGAGLRSNEIPAILEKGEIVLPANSNFAPQRVQIDVSFSVDGSGNIIPMVRQVSGEEADIRVSRAAPAIVGAATNQANKSAPAAVAKYQQQRGGSDWRVM